MAKIHHFIIYNIGKLSNRVEDEAKQVYEDVSERTCFGSSIICR